MDYKYITHGNQNQELNYRKSTICGAEDSAWIQYEYPNQRNDGGVEGAVVGG